MTEEQRAEQIRALIRERSHYEATGRSDRVKSVDIELKNLGHGATPAKRAAKRG